MSKPSRAKTDYTFILAASHSGSTLLSLLLNAHPDAATVGEMTSGAYRMLEGYRCSCRRLIVECPFWQAITTSMRQRHTTFNLSDFGIQFEKPAPWWLNRLLRFEHRGPALEACRDAVLSVVPSWRRHFATTTALCEDFAVQILEVSGARVLVDSSKLAHRLKFVRRIPGFDVKVVHLVRDGRAVALTYMDSDTFADSSDASLRRGGRGLDGPAQHVRLPMERAAEEWVRSIRSAEFALATLRPDQWIRIRYEDLCTRTEATLARVFTFLGLDPGRAADSFRAVEHHIVGNGMRMDSTSDVRLDERWKSVLSAADLAVFERVAGDLNRRFYPPEPRSRFGELSTSVTRSPLKQSSSGAA